MMSSPTTGISTFETCSSGGQCILFKRKTQIYYTYIYNTHNIYYTYIYYTTILYLYIQYKYILQNILFYIL